MQQVRAPAPRRPTRHLPAVLVSLFVVGCSVYANLSFTVTDRTDYRYFPPFRAYADFNMNDHLGAEYMNVARALVAGKGFADPFEEPTGPTAWMPPAFPCLLAA